MIMERRYHDRAALAAALARHIAARLCASIALRDRAVLVLSGGSTPRATYARLAKEDLSWERVTITLADERWVAPGHPDSNEGLVCRTLLRGPVAQAAFVGLWSATATPRQGEAECRARLAGLDRPFDLVLLGMGQDGHTASLFPGAPELDQALDPGSGLACMAISPPTAGQGRMTLTLPALLDSREILVLITGRDKLATLEKAREEGPPSAMPIRSILRSQHSETTIFWAP